MLIPATVNDLGPLPCLLPMSFLEHEKTMTAITAGISKVNNILVCLFHKVVYEAQV